MDQPSKNIEIKTLKSFSSAPTANSGIFITFNPSHNETQAKKSCIEHLPGSYYKVDLGGKMDFVVVFQAIQIERLSMQVYNLRVLLKGSERQIANYLNYEVQIKELTESYHQLQLQLKSYQSQLQKMSLACNALYQQNSQTKNLFQQEKNESAQLIDALKKENQQLKLKIREAAQADKENQLKRQLISQDLVRLNQNLLLGQSQLGDLRENYAQKQQEIQQSNSQITTLQSNLRNAENHLRQAEREINNRGQQLQNLKRILDQTLDQANNFKQKYQNQRKCNEDMQRQCELLQRQAEQVKREIQAKDTANRELNQSISELKREMMISKQQAQQMNRCLSDLQRRIDQGTGQILKIKQVLESFNDEIQRANLREQQLTDKIATLEGVLSQNHQLNNEIAQLNARLGEKQDEIYQKEQNITQITTQSQQLYQQNQSLQNNAQNLAQTMNQLEKTLNQERKANQSERAILIEEQQKVLNKQKEERNKIQKQLTKVKEQGLIHESTKIQVAALKNTCQKQAQQIKNINNILENMSKLVSNLKDKNKEYSEVEQANQSLRKQLNSSLLLNEQLIERVSTQLTEMSNLMEEIQALDENLRKQKDKNDDFINCSTQKTILSTESSRQPLIQSKVESSSSFLNNFTKQRYSPPQIPQFSLYNLPNDRRANEKSYSTYDSNTTNSNSLSKDSIVGKLDLNSSASSASDLAKSMMVNDNDGVLFESRKVLQTSGYFPALQGKDEIYKGNLSYRQSASSAYEKFKRQRRL